MRNSSTYPTPITWWPAMPMMRSTTRCSGSSPNCLVTEAPSTDETAVSIKNQRRDVGLKLTLVARQLRQGFDQSVERSGLTRAKWTLIAAVAQSPGATQRILAEALHVREITVGRVIDRLCAEGYLKRR